MLKLPRACWLSQSRDAHMSVSILKHLNLQATYAWAVGVEKGAGDRSDFYLLITGHHC